MIVSRLDLACITACLLLYTGQALAQTEANDAENTPWSESVSRALPVTQLPRRVEQGREIYEMCSECHLASGSGQSDGTMPQLAGQHRSVLIKQLMDIQSGTRKNPAMHPFVSQLDGQGDFADVATYIETLPIDENNGKGPGVDLERGRDLYLKDCAQCHGERGEGSADAFYPKLTGQHYRYLVRQIIDIVGARRGNANFDMVRAVEEYSARDVSIVADYVSRLRASAPEVRR